MKNPSKNFFICFYAIAAVLFFYYRALAAEKRYLSFQPAAMKQWNFLVYLNGVNSLDSFGTLNMNQMEELGSNDQMNIIVQWGSLSRTNVERILVQKDNSPSVTSPVVQDLGVSDMGDWHELVAFADWANTQYPAQHTFIVVWNHGSGWHRPQMISPLDISFDDRTGNSIKTEELGLAMKQIAQITGKKVDVYASDACLMGMVEVADEMKESVNYFVGSQDLEPDAGWPYNKFLAQWQSQPQASAKEISLMLSHEYAAAYSSGGLYGRADATMSVFDLNYMDQYRQAVKNLTTEMMTSASRNKSAILKMIEDTKYFSEDDYRDMMDFTNKLMTASLIKKSGEDFKKAHQNFVIANEQNQDQKTFGLSVWLPSDANNFKAYGDRYEKLSFNRNTNWKNFLEKLF